MTEQNRDSSIASSYDLAVPEDEVAKKASDYFCKYGITAGHCCMCPCKNEWMEHYTVAQVMFRLLKTVIFAFLARRKWFRSCLAWIQYACAASQTATKNHKVFLITSLLFWTSPGAQVGKEKCVYSTDDDERLDWQKKKKKSAKARQFETADKVSVFLPNSFPVCMGVTAGPMLWTDLDYHHIGLAVLKQTMSRE